MMAWRIHRPRRSPQSQKAGDIIHQLIISEHIK
jgi:hypothetical protein